MPQHRCHAGAARGLNKPIKSSKRRYPESRPVIVGDNPGVCCGALPQPAKATMAVQQHIPTPLCATRGAGVAVQVHCSPASCQVRPTPCPSHRSSRKFSCKHGLDMLMLRPARHRCGMKRMPLCPFRSCAPLWEWPYE